MATAIAPRMRLKQGINEAVEGKANFVPFRVIFGKRIVSTTHALTWVVANFSASGQDLAADAAGYSEPGENMSNNFLDSAARPKFKFAPEAVGLYITDPGDERVRSILLEGSTFELKFSESAFLARSPTILLPPGLGIGRTLATTVAGITPSAEQHGLASPREAGVYPLPKGLVFGTDKTVSAKLWVEAAPLAALAALAGSTPAQGIGIYVVMYGRAVRKLALT